jgi:hypothetical protein
MSPDFFQGPLEDKPALGWELQCREAFQKLSWKWCPARSRDWVGVTSKRALGWREGLSYQGLRTGTEERTQSREMKGWLDCSGKVNQRSMASLYILMGFFFHLFFLIFVFWARLTAEFWTGNICKSTLQILGGLFICKLSIITTTSTGKKAL